MSGRLDGKACLVTAAGQGIGRETAQPVKAAPLVIPGVPKGRPGTQGTGRTALGPGSSLRCGRDDE